MNIYRCVAADVLQDAGIVTFANLLFNHVLIV